MDNQEATKVLKELLDIPNGDMKRVGTWHLKALAYKIDKLEKKCEVSKKD